MATKKTMRHASALKAHRKSLVRKAQNFQVRNEARTLVANVLKAVSEKNVEAAKISFKLAQSAWQRAARKGIFHRSAAARKISRLASRIATLSKS